MTGVEQVDDMTEIIRCQVNSGMFDADVVDWEKNVFKIYFGSFEKIRLGCPEKLDGSWFIQNNTWFTALCIKMLETKMMDKKELWELVANKAYKYLRQKFCSNERQIQDLMQKAEEYLRK